MMNLKKTANRIAVLQAELDILNYDYEITYKDDPRKQALTLAKIDGKKLQIQEKQSGAEYNQKLIMDCAKIADFCATKAVDLKETYGDDIANIEDEEDEYWVERFSNNVVAEKLAKQLQVDVGTAQSILQLPLETQVKVIDMVEEKNSHVIGLLTGSYKNLLKVANATLLDNKETERKDIYDILYMDMPEANREEMRNLNNRQYSKPETDEAKWEYEIKQRVRELLKDDPEKMYKLLAQHPRIQEMWLEEVDGRPPHGTNAAMSNYPITKD
jgi:hypothetical protein